jgi:hypothetical protein
LDQLATLDQLVPVEKQDLQDLKVQLDSLDQTEPLDSLDLVVQLVQLEVLV